MGKDATLACWGVVVVTWIAGALYGARNAHPRHQRSSASLWAIGSVVGAIVVVQFAWNDVTAGRTDWRYCLRRYYDLWVVPARSAT